MNPRTTGILLLVAVALGAFLWLYELEGESGRLEREQAGKRLFAALEAEDVEWIALESDDGQPARFERREAGWWMVEPVEFPAASAVERMAEALVSLGHEARFEEAAPDAEYGLDAESARSVRFGAGGEEHRLRLGRDTPVGSNRYARADEGGPVLTVAAYRTTAFEGALDDWRDPQLLDFDVAAVRELRVGWAEGGVRLRRADAPGSVAVEEGEDEDEAAEAEETAAWTLLEPLETRADAEAVDELLATLSFLRGEGFVDDPGESERALFEPPAWSATLLLEGDAEPRRLEISRVEEGGERRLARVAGRSTLFALPADRIDDFPREVVAYRDRSLASFPVTEAAHVDFYYRGPAGDPVVIRARSTDSGWESEPESFAPGALSRLVSALSRLEAASVLAEEASPEQLETLGLAPPETVISVFGAEPEEEGETAGGPPRLAEVHLGRASPEGIAARTPERETVFELDIELADRIPVSLDAFRSRFRADPEPAAEPAGEPGDLFPLPTPAEESP